MRLMIATRHESSGSALILFK